MLNRFVIPVWKEAPFIRLLLPFATGIIGQWYLQISLPLIVMAAISFAAANMAFIFLPLSVKFKLQSLQGILINLLLVIFGLLISWQKDVRHNNNWYGKFYKDTAYIIATINEPLTEKTKSYKADAAVESVIVNDSTFTGTGKLLLYFSKDSLAQQLHYGDKILIHKSIQPIKNSGNPGAFNYQRYAAFQQTFHNVFLKDKDWVVLTEKNINPFWQFIYSAKEKILFALQKNISNGKDELGIAEALLIGYTNDLDKDLVQAYSNTGVVHIIAISGMHLALIYVMLVWLFARIPVINKSKGMQVLLIVGCLWLFSLLTGGSASVIRSAVMFTFITIGKMFFKQSSIFNSLAASAFVMLCYNPYYLWDVGFQLSYLAVVGIVIFQKPIYNLFYIKNKWIDKIWQMFAITTAAQLLTFPVCIYYFHQFPLLFLITNLVAVPLSTIILYAEIVLVAFSWIPFVGIIAGKITGWLLALMNTFIVGVNNLSFSVWDKIPATLFTTLLLYAVVVFAAAWLLNKNRAMLRVAMFSLLGFVITHNLMAWKIKEQQKIIVYNVPQHKAIDFVTGNNYLFNGDSVLLEEGLLQNFHLKPGRIALQLNQGKDFLPELFNKENFYQLGNNRIVLIDKPLILEPPQQKINVDIIIISKNPKLYIPQLASVFNCRQYVFDASNSLWKIDKWKQDCDKLNLRFHSIPEKGAFVMDL
jgi:competence protein ComEC